MIAKRRGFARAHPPGIGARSDQQHHALARRQRPIKDRCRPGHRGQNVGWIKVQNGAGMGEEPPFHNLIYLLFTQCRTPGVGRGFGHAVLARRIRGIDRVTFRPHAGLAQRRPAIQHHQLQAKVCHQRGQSRRQITLGQAVHDHRPLQPLAALMPDQPVADGCRSFVAAEQNGGIQPGEQGGFGRGGGDHRRTGGKGQDQRLPRSRLKARHHQPPRHIALFGQGGGTGWPVPRKDIWPGAAGKESAKGHAVAGGP